MIFDIYHHTCFEYQSDVTFSHNLVRLKPRNTLFQRLLDFSMEVDPEEFDKSFFIDLFGNTNKHILVRKAHRALHVTAHSRVELFRTTIEAHIEQLRSQPMSYAKALEYLHTPKSEDLVAKLYTVESELIPKASSKIRSYALDSFDPGRDLFDAMLEFMERIYNDFEFVPGISDVNTPAEETFESKKGVCQDFAHFAIAALRSIGLPARYVSGYIETLPPEGEEKLFGVDASHAWVSLYIPSLGWIDFDPTNNQLPTTQHIMLGYGRDYYDVAPLKGVVMSSGASKLSIQVDVKRVHPV